MQGDVFNPQTQHPVTWPAEPAVAMAYVDQLRRSGDMADRFGEEIHAALKDSDARKLKRLIGMVEPEDGNGLAVRRKAALVEVLTAIAEEL